MNEKDYDKIIKRKLKHEYAKEKATITEQLADVVTKFGSSWIFIVSFISFFLFWIFFNLFIYTFDAPPFIMLNLILSCLAVFQAPFILMSQNRLHEIDRKREENSYIVNLKQELELQELHHKLDLLLDETRAD